MHAIAIRSGSDDLVAELAEAADVPVINALTPHHPCQALADLLTLRERFGELEGLRLAYVGDGNNVARSLAILGRTAGLDVAIAGPNGYRIEAGLAELVDDPRAAVSGADAVYTDVWVSMGDEAEAESRRRDLAPYQVNEELLDAASDRAVAPTASPPTPARRSPRGALRRALRGLGPGGEPAACPEGAPRAAGPRLSGAQSPGRAARRRSPGCACRRVGAALVVVVAG